MMKYVVVAFALVAIVTCAPVSNDERKRIVKECVAETGVNKDILKQAFSGHFTEDEKLEDFAFCALKKLGIESEDGEIHTETATNQLPEEFSEAERDTFLNTCLHKKGSTPRRTAYLIYKCFRELSPIKSK